MSEDEKETPGLGLQFCLQPGFHPEKQWSPGVRVASPEEFDQFTAQLAQNLLETYSPEYIATIAAQRIILLDMSKCVSEENEANQDALVKALTETTQQAAFHVLCSFRKKEAKKRMEGGLDQIAKRRALIRAEIERHARELWAADTEEEYKITEMAGLVRDAVEQDFPGESSGIDNIKRLIRPVAPEHAKKGGRPKASTSA
ncbi:hypothetical protein ACUTAF_15320 [Pseudomonas sp. SP16.1]|uniref:hypothetical protein n=1 Tax=Pseudomonas sp. SP16.1 TaxID=3458854 RepID=UPI0040452151